MSRTSADIRREIKEIQACLDECVKGSAKLTEYVGIIKENVIVPETNSERFVGGDRTIMDVVMKSISVINDYIDDYKESAEDQNEIIYNLQKDLAAVIEEEKKLSKLINFSLPISDKLIAKMGLHVLPRPISKGELEDMEDMKEAEKIADEYKRDAMLLMICQLTENDVPETNLIGLEIILMAEILKRTDHGAAFVKAVEESFGKLTNVGGNAADIRNLFNSYLSGM